MSVPLTYVAELLEVLDVSVLSIDPGQCWVCDAPADSREHRIKKSDVVAKYGSGPYAGPTRPVHVVEKEAPRSFQGPNSQQLKYSGSLCSKCNNARSQSYDRAYEKLVAWVEANSEAVLASRQIDLNTVYGAKRPAQIQNLLRYFAKNLGCRIQASCLPVPLSLRLAVAGGPLTQSLRVSLCVNEDLAEHREFLGDFLGKTSLLANGGRGAPFFEWAESFGWLQFVVRYRLPAQDAGASPLEPETNIATIGSCWPLSESMRLEGRRKFAELRAQQKPRTGSVSD